MSWGFNNPDGTQNYATQLYNWFRNEPISTRAKQFAVAYTAGTRAIEGNYLGAIGAIRYWPRGTNTGRRYTRRRSRRYKQRQRYTRSRNSKRTRGFRIYKGVLKDGRARKRITVAELLAAGHSSHDQPKKSGLYPQKHRVGRQGRKPRHYTTRDDWYEYRHTRNQSRFFG